MNDVFTTATGGSRTGAPGRLMAAEIAEQPAVWAGLLDEGRQHIRSAAREIAARRPRYVLLAARGTSDHAALYAKYLVEIVLGLPAGLASPSVFTAYEARPDLRDVLLVGISQSGGSPDLVTTLEAGQAHGALTLAVTNNAESELARAARLHLGIRAGAERAVAATKSYTAQLLTLYLLVYELSGQPAEKTGLLPEWGERVVSGSATVEALADRYRFAQRMVLTGRGYSYATAREAALKFMETSYVSAQAFSGADLLHGPLAMLDPQIPVVTVISDGPGGRTMSLVLDRLGQLGADVLCVGSPDAVGRAGRGFALPEGVPEALAPLLEIVPLQQLALRLALARGHDPDAPRGLGKVTRTR